VELFGVLPDTPELNSIRVWPPDMPLPFTGGNRTDEGRQ
jgi:hypothetical protein